MCHLLLAIKIGIFVPPHWIYKNHKGLWFISPWWKRTWSLKPRFPFCSSDFSPYCLIPGCAIQSDPWVYPYLSQVHDSIAVSTKQSLLCILLIFRPQLVPHVSFASPHGICKVWVGFFEQWCQCKEKIKRI